MWGEKTMADFRAITAVSGAVLKLLESNFRPEDFNNAQLEFKSYTWKNFSGLISTGVSLFLYRVYHNVSCRTPPGRIDANGQRLKTELPIDIHFFLTAWAEHATLQHTIAGWMMRIMEDFPILPASLLNSVITGVFRPEETVEVCLTEVSNEDLLRFWDRLVAEGFNISVPYVARNVRIESTKSAAVGVEAQNRVFEY